MGGGERKAFNALDAEGLGGRVVARWLVSGETTATLVLEDLEGCAVDGGEAAARAAAAAHLRAYRFDKYRAPKPKERTPTLEKFNVATSSFTAARKAFAGQEPVLAGVERTRDLVSEPANILYPEAFANRCKDLAELGVQVTVLGEKQMAKLGMNALLGVGQGSTRDSQLVVLKWNGADDPKSAPVAFVGKGVTFDTGGISLKPGPGMGDMKWDMGGAGVVTGLMTALAGRKAKVNAIGILGLVENMPDGAAQRPGDVVTSAAGKTIEILNTDAEGRLVLADALWYVQDKFKPSLVIDLATLTGAIIAALAHEYAGLFTSDDELADKLMSAGKAVGEGLWRMPMGPAYDRMIDSPIADMKNIGGRWAGSTTAAQFLARFIEDGTPWAHIDIAGVTWNDAAPKPTSPKGATGWGVRMLDEFVRQNYEAED